MYMSIGSGIAIAGAFLGTAIAAFAAGMPGTIFVAPAVATFFIVIFG